MIRPPAKAVALGRQALAAVSAAILISSCAVTPSSEDVESQASRTDVDLRFELGFSQQRLKTETKLVDRPLLVVSDTADPADDQIRLRDARVLIPSIAVGDVLDYPIPRSLEVVVGCQPAVFTAGSEWANLGTGSEVAVFDASTGELLGLTEFPSGVWINDVCRVEFSVALVASAAFYRLDVGGERDPLWSVRFAEGQIVNGLFRRSVDW